MWSIENRVGRLVELRIWSPVSLEEVPPWARRHDEVIAALSGPYVCLVDVSRATVFPQDVVDRYVAYMKAEPNLVRTGVLLSASPTQSLQIARMIREAAAPNRKAFRAPDELAAWLSQSLEEKEAARLRQALRETPGAH